MCDPCDYEPTELEREIAEKDAELAKVKHGASKLRCPEHAMDASWAWGCPGCVADLRKEARALKELLREALLRCSGWTYFSAGATGVPRGSDTGFEDWKRAAKALLSGVEHPGEPK